MTLARITDRTQVDTTAGCWVWCGGVDRCGYGQISVGGRMRQVHREAYAILGGVVPPVLRQGCGNRRCWRPDHMTPSTSREATLAGDGPTARHARKTHCPQKHRYDDANTRVARGRRHCRTCHRDRLRRNRAAKHRHLNRVS